MPDAPSGQDQPVQHSAARASGRGAPALHEWLVAAIAVAAALGVAFPAAARDLRPGVPAMLACQVLGVALTMTLDELRPGRRDVGRLAAALGAQWALLPLAGLGIEHLAGGAVGQGAFITAAAPAEITSVLVAVVAGGRTPLAAALMTASVALGCVLTPLWLLLLAGTDVGPGFLVPELALSVALPLAVGVAARSRFPSVGRHPRSCLDLAAAGLVLVVFVGAGEARHLLVSRAVGGALLFALALVLAGAVVGLATSAALGGPLPERIALAFPVAMREFGIATAVAILAVPRAAGFGGIYGIVMMFAATLSAGLLRRRRRREGDGTSMVGRDSP